MLGMCISEMFKAETKISGCRRCLKPWRADMIYQGGCVGRGEQYAGLGALKDASIWGSQERISGGARMGSWRHQKAPAEGRDRASATLPSPVPLSSQHTNILSFPLSLKQNKTSVPCAFLSHTLYISFPSPKHFWQELSAVMFLVPHLPLNLLQPHLHPYNETAFLLSRSPVI